MPCSAIFIVNVGVDVDVDVNVNVDVLAPSPDFRGVVVCVEQRGERLA